MQYITKTNLSLPFKGEWMVTNGGQDPLKNSHLRPDGPQNQLYSYDFRKSHQGEGKKLEDYEVFGEEVLSPGDGTIVQVIDGSFDVLPGEKDRSVGVGNAIIIDHNNGEWSMLCHFKHNSIKVGVGDKIKQGDLLGLCGNSGNTSEPHVHFSFQDGSLMHTAQALPATFTEILVDGVLTQNAEPERGQKVSNR